MKTYVIFVFAFLISAVTFAQSDAVYTDSDYSKLLRKSRSQVNKFIEQREAFAMAEKSYAETINSIIETIDVNAIQDKKQAQSHIEWVSSIAPLYISTAGSKKATRQRIDLVVNNFGETFNISPEKQSLFRNQLEAYYGAYQDFAVSLGGFQNILSFGPGFSKGAPIPVQVHQVHQVHQTHQPHQVHRGN